MSESFNIRSSVEIAEVSKTEPCIHCGKPDWCYRIGEITACKRGVEPATGWEKTSKADKDGTPYYAAIAPKKAVRPKAKKEFFYCDRDGSKLIKITRTDDGEGNRKFYQSHWNGDRYIKGVPAEIQQQVPIYRYPQVQKAIAAGRPVFLVEGEGCADALWSVGITATTTLGGSGKYRSYGSYQEDLAGATLVLCPDRDEPGVKHMEEIANDFPAARWLYAPPEDFYWQHLAKSGGLDVADWLSDGATADDIREAAGDKKAFGLPEKPLVETDNTDVLDADDDPLIAPTADEVFTQKAVDALYSTTRWISVDGNLHRWTGTHYKLVSSAAEKARIAAWCNSTAVQSMRGWSYAYAKSHIVEGIYNWLLVSCAIDPEGVNPPGLNCLNGVLKIHWQGNQPTWELAAHDPQIIYTYIGEFEFDSSADSDACDRLLSCLDPEQRDIFIKTLAATLDLNTIRYYRGRGIKALLCKGDGNNGKDSLREAVQLLYGFGVVSCTVSDFASYDQGRKFTLAKLENARISWSSENSSFSQLDNLQSLKAAITGEPLDLEHKNKDERMMSPCTVFFFNINNVPNLQASLEAIQSRWAVLSFTKTFKTNADPKKGEIEADPRFRYDPNFLRREVVPALLNKMLAALPEVAAKAIDYRCTDAALEEIQRETNHLRAFCQDVGLDYQTDGVIYGGETWKILKQWYIENGTLEITVDDKGKEKEKWNDQSNSKDTNVKGSNSILGRLHQLFPKAQRGKDTQQYKNRACLKGVGFGEASEADG